MKAVEQFGWSKGELIIGIGCNMHENIILSIDEDISPPKMNNSVVEVYIVRVFCKCKLYRLRGFVKVMKACIEKFCTERYYALTLRPTVIMRC